MLKYLRIFVLVLVALAAARSALCQDDSDWDLKTVDGWIISVDAQESKMALKTSEEIMFYVPSTASITNADGFSIRLSDINKENYAMVSYIDDDSGRHVVRSINVEYRT
jgi:hypothetical protein